MTPRGATRVRPGGRRAGPVVAGAVLAAFACVVLAACAAGPSTVVPGPGKATPAPRSAAPGSPSASVQGGVPHCVDVPILAAPASWYRTTPIYVGNEMPTDAVRAWAEGRPGFAEVWIDREHQGWISVGFTADVEARQAELAAAFPGVGVVAVSVPHGAAELEALATRVTAEAETLGVVMMATSVHRGVVEVGIGVLEPERVAALVARFGGEPICVDGIDPADAPAPGPQATGGDGWRLLAHAAGEGHAYRTGIAYDAASYTALRVAAGLQDVPAPVDFETEVAVWFGAVTGSSCPDLRLDGVVVDRERVARPRGPRPGRGHRLHGRHLPPDIPRRTAPRPAAARVPSRSSSTPRTRPRAPPRSAPWWTWTSRTRGLSPARGTCTGIRRCSIRRRGPRPLGTSWRPGSRRSSASRSRAAQRGSARSTTRGGARVDPAAADGTLPVEWQARIADDGTLTATILVDTDPARLRVTSGGRAIDYIAVPGAPDCP